MFEITPELMKALQDDKLRRARCERIRQEARKASRSGRKSR